MRKLLVIGIAALLMAPAASQAATRDRARPVVRYSTANGAVLIGTGRTIAGAPTAVAGAATDTGTGIKRIDVWAIPCNTQASDTFCGYVGPWTSLTDTGAVTVSCNRARTSCSWSANAPMQPGWYWMGAEATDRAGNFSRPAGILRILVA